MKHSSINQERCLALVNKLNAELAWGLDSTQQQKYVADLRTHMTNIMLESEMQKVIELYHDDHAIVESLMDRTNPQHEEAWVTWGMNVLRIVRSQYKVKAHSQLEDEVDRVQIVLEELIRALPTFHYKSRFSTWAYTIVTRRVIRLYRDSQAAKRQINNNSESLNTNEKHTQVRDSASNPENHSQDTLLWQLVTNILDSHGDTRYSKIFELWMHGDMRLSDIGRQMDLSTASISRLIDQICALLRNNPELRAWLNYRPRERAKGDEQDLDDASR